MTLFLSVLGHAPHSCFSQQGRSSSQKCAAAQECRPAIVTGSRPELGLPTKTRHTNDQTFLLKIQTYAGHDVVQTQRRCVGKFRVCVKYSLRRRRCMPHANVVMYSDSSARATVRIDLHNNDGRSSFWATIIKNLPTLIATPSLSNR
jgi:hypothetical protein